MSASVFVPPRASTKTVVSFLTGRKLRYRMIEATGAIAGVEQRYGL